MPTTVEELGPCKRRLSIEIPAEKVKKAFDDAYRELGRQVRIPGFRPGHAPRRILVKRYGEDVVKDVRDRLVQQAIGEGLEEHDIDAVGHPHFEGDLPELDENAPYAFELTLEVKPEIQLPCVEEIEVTREIKQVGDDDIQEVIENLRKEHAEWLPVEDEEAACKDDIVIGKLALLDDDGEEVYSTDTAHAHVGFDDDLVGLPMEGLKDSLPGKKIGDTLEFRTHVPEDYPVSDLRDRDLAARFTINEVKRMVLPSEEELAVNMGEDDVESFRGRLRELLEQRMAEESNRVLKESIVDQLIEKTDFQLPEHVLASSTEAASRQMMVQKIYAGEIAQGDDLKEIQAGLTEEAAKRAERGLRAWYILEQIAKENEIEVTPSEMNAKINAMARASQRKPKEVVEEIRKDNRWGEIQAEIIEEKALDWLVEHVRVKDEAGEVDKEDEGSPTSTESEGNEA